MQRQKTLEQLKQNPELSVLVIGGGVNGAGVFRDLALQGIDVLLVDQADFAAGASSAPSRMIHGGLRYLENGEFHLVNESLKERNLLLQNAAHYVNPLPTSIPIFSRFSGLFNAASTFFRLRNKPNARGSIVIKIGLTFYDFFTRKKQVLPRHTFSSRKESLQRWPKLNKAIVCTASYFDAWISYPERLCLELVLDAEKNDDAHALNYLAVEDAEGDTVILKDSVSGEEIKVKPKIVINATGAWIDFTNKAMKQETQMIGGTKGSHIIVNHPELLQALDANMIYYENPEGRVCILYPFMGNVLIGSTDIPVDDPAEALCSPEEIDYIMESVASVFPDIEIKKSDIVFQYCGVRPLPRSNSKFTGRISRAHSCRITDADEQNHFKTYSMIGGKWTTFRGFADEVTEQVLAELNKKRQSTTEDIAIGGGLEFPRTDEACQQWLENLHGKTDIALDRLQILLERYGTIASTVADYISAETDSPLETLPEYSVRELEYIMKFERVMHLDDIVLRRTSIAIRGLLDSTVLNEISQIAQTVFDWSDSDTLDELKHCKDSLEKHHGIQFSGD